MTSLPVEMLSASELAELRAFLASDAFADDAPHLSGLEELQGFLAAVICTPEMIMPSEWLGFALGDPTYESQAQAGRVMTLVLRLYNDASQTLSSSKKVAAWFPPRQAESVAGASAAQLWCRGFVHGMALRYPSWRGLDHDDELARCLLPIVALGGTSAKNKLTELRAAHEMELMQALPQAVETLYERMRRLSASGPPPAKIAPLPRYEDADLAFRSVPELLALMVKDEDRVPRNVIDALARRGAETLEVLRSRVEGRDFWSHDATSGEWWLRLHVVMVLGLLPAAEAGGLLVAAMRRMSEEQDENLQGWFGGFWPALFRNKPVSLSDPLRALSEDRKLDWYMRSYAAETVVALASREGTATLEAALDWLAHLVSDETEDWEMRLCSASPLLDFPRARHRALLGLLAARQQKPYVHFSKEDIEEAYAAGKDKPGWRRFEDPWRFYTPEAIAARQERWAKEDAEEDHREARAAGDYFEDEDSAPHIRAEPKIGRNDPCPCGSGKKYKKCHGAPGASPLLH